MNVIDALVITLGLDPKGFEKGRKDVDSGMKDLREKSAKTAKEMEEQGKKAAAFFSSVKVELLGLLAAFGAASGLKEFIGSSVTGMAALGRASANVGVATEHLQAWGAAAEAAGGQASDALSAFQNIANGVAEAQIKVTSAFTNWARMNGVALTDQNKKLLDNEQIMMNIRKLALDIAGSGPGGRARAISFLGMGGFSGANANELLMPGFDAFMKQAEAKAQRNANITQQMILFQQKWALVRMDLQAIQDKIFIKLEPELEILTAKLTKFLDGVNWDHVIAQAEKWLGDVKSVVDALGGIKGILIDIAAIKVFGWAASIGSTILQLRSLTAALIAARAAAAGGAVPAGAAPAAAAATGFWAKLLGAGGWMGLLKAAALAPRPADDRAILEQLSPDQAAKFKADAQKSWLQRWADLFGIGSSDVASSPVAVAPRKHMATRADDNIELFGGKYSGKVSTAQLLSSLEKKNGLPAGLLSGVLAAESNNNDPRYQRSAKGALGPFQFEPATASDYGLTGKDVFDFNKSANAAARYLHDLIAMFHGNVPMAVAAYNWGMGNVQNKGMGHLPAETRDYLNKVLGGVRVGAATVAMAKQSAPSTTNTSTSQTQINGPITVNTKATDAHGIARDLHTALANNAVVAQANTGLN